MAVVAAGMAWTTAGPKTAQGQASTEIFEDDFSAGLERWSFPGTAGHQLIDGGLQRGAVLQLQTVSGQVYALMDGSEHWSDVRIEGLVSFPEDRHSYLGFIYRYVDDGRRIDFGSLYIKGNDSYLQANPHHDTNVGRTIYPEARTNLSGERAVVIGAWQRFALEVVGSDAHLYVGDMGTPALTLRGHLAPRGAFGFKPRNPGARVLIDDVTVRPIDGFTYHGRPIPDPSYTREAFVTEWSVLGPLTRNLPTRLEGSFDEDLTVEDDGRSVSWRPFTADHRGAIVTASVTEYRGSRRVAYFHAEVQSEDGGDAVLLISSTDDLAIWVNGVFAGFLPRQGRAWWDSLDNPEHRPARAFVTLRSGRNDIVIRVAGGVYATGGFYLAVRDPEAG